MAPRHRLASGLPRLLSHQAARGAAASSPATLQPHVLLARARRLLAGELPVSSALLRGIIDSLAEGVVVANLERRFVLFNPAAEHILSLGMKDVPMEQWSEAYGCYRPDTMAAFPSEELPLARSLRGEAVDDCEIFIRKNGGPGGGWISVSSRPVADRRGRVFGGVATIRDITARKQQVERQRLLTKIVEETADAVLVTDRTGSIEYVNAAFERMTGFSREEVIGRNPRLLKSGAHTHAFYDDLWERLRRGDVCRDTITDRRKNGELYLSSQTITPLKADDGTISHIVSIARDVTERRKAQTIENSLRLARQVQQRLFPTSAPRVAGLDAWGMSIPAEATGGDYFDFLDLPDGALGLVIGDVSGHGIDSAITMAQTRVLVRAAARDHADPGEILADVNALLVPDLGEHRFVGMTIVAINPRTRAISYANAGHTPGFLLDRTGRVRMELTSTGLVLGLFEDTSFATVRGPDLSIGDVLVLITDGVTEAEGADGSMCGPEWALDLVRANAQRSAADILGRLSDLVQKFAARGYLHDDATSIVCRVGDWG